nr:MAG TPA: minor tail protein [Caudoviricetes sp.]
MAATGKNYQVKVSLYADVKEGTRNVNSALDKIKKSVKDLKVKFDVDTANLKSVASTGKELKEVFQDAGGAVATVVHNLDKGYSEAKVTIRNTNKELKSNTSEIEKQSKQVKTLSYSWSKAWEGATKYSLVMGSIVYARRAIANMVDSVRELDDYLVELRKVTDLEGESLDNFTKKAYEAGEGLAKTGSEMIDAATSFAKAGYGEDAILQLGEVASMYTNIADETISAGDAADFIIAQLKAFRLESEDVNKTLENSYHIIDAVDFC